MNKEYYDLGFIDACIEKRAMMLPIPAWGGGSYNSNNGLGATAGYTYLLGGIPVPFAGLRAGGRHGGISLTGPIPGLGLDAGMPPERGWYNNEIPSLWKMLGDKIRELKARRAEAIELKSAGASLLSTTPTIEHNIMDTFVPGKDRRTKNKTKPGSEIMQDTREATSTGSTRNVFSRAGYAGAGYKRPN